MNKMEKTVEGLYEEFGVCVGCLESECIVASKGVSIIKCSKIQKVMEIINKILLD